MQHTMNQPGIPQEADFLPSGASQDLSSFEFALITLMFGFQSWVQDCMDAAGFRGLLIEPNVDMIPLLKVPIPPELTAALIEQYEALAKPLAQRRLRQMSPLTAKPPTSPR